MKTGPQEQGICLILLTTVVLASLVSVSYNNFQIKIQFIPGISLHVMFKKKYRGRSKMVTE